MEKKSWLFKNIEKLYKDDAHHNNTTKTKRDSWTGAYVDYIVLIGKAKQMSSCFCKLLLDTCNHGNDQTLQLRICKYVSKNSSVDPSLNNMLPFKF